MGLFREIQNLIVEHGGSTVLKERVLLLKDQMDKMVEECRDLKMELAQCHEEKEKLRQQLEAQSVVEKFVEYRGALFKRGLSGAYDPTVYCPVCNVPLWSMEGVTPYMCERCDVVLNFTERDLPQILQELEELT